MFYTFSLYSYVDYIKKILLFMCDNFNTIKIYEQGKTSSNLLHEYSKAEVLWNFMTLYKKERSLFIKHSFGFRFKITCFPRSDFFRAFSEHFRHIFSEFSAHFQHIFSAFSAHSQHFQWEFSVFSEHFQHVFPFDKCS